MKAHLLFCDRDIDMAAVLPSQHADLVADLDLDTLLTAMADGDPLVAAVSRTVLLDSLRDGDAIRYRQEVLRDCLDNQPVVDRLYAMTGEALAEAKKGFGWLDSRIPAARLSRAISIVGSLVGLLRELRAIAENADVTFRATGFRAFFATLRQDLDETFFDGVADHLRRLQFQDGVVVSARLDERLCGTDYVLRRPSEPRSWLARLLDLQPDGYVVRLAERDEAGARAMSDLRDRGIVLVAEALARSTEHILSFFRALRTELAFYRGGATLHRALTGLSVQLTMPIVEAAGSFRRDAHDLSEPGLALRLNRKATPSDLPASGRGLIIVTGANQGGKSTFLRSLGVAQLMMQCGLFVAARRFSSPICHGLFTHYRREEDASMASGKLDEELARMSAIVDRLEPHALVLMNESFAATNEREGSEIGRQIIDALIDAEIDVILVTHLYDLAASYDRGGPPRVVFLRPERLEAGRRSFRIVEGKPLPTSFGDDVYMMIFGQPLGEAEAALARGRAAAQMSIDPRRTTGSDEGTWQAASDHDRQSNDPRARLQVVQQFVTPTNADGNDGDRE